MAKPTTGEFDCAFVLPTFSAGERFRVGGSTSGAEQEVPRKKRRNKQLHHPKIPVQVAA